MSASTTGPAGSTVCTTPPRSGNACGARAASSSSPCSSSRPSSTATSHRWARPLRHSTRSTPAIAPGFCSPRSSPASTFSISCGSRRRSEPRWPMRGLGAGRRLFAVRLARPPPPVGRGGEPSAPDPESGYPRWVVIREPGAPRSTAGNTASGRSSASRWSCGRSSISPYSPLSDSIGSTRDARRAGRYAASRPTTTIPPATAAKVPGSSASTPNRRLRSARVDAAATASPTTTPINRTRAPCPTTIPWTRRARARILRT